MQNEPMSPYGKVLFDCFKSPDPNKQIESLNKLCEKSKFDEGMSVEEAQYAESQKGHNID